MIHILSLGESDEEDFYSCIAKPMKIGILVRRGMNLNP
jgi:hypothetical protein